VTIEFEKAVYTALFLRKIESSRSTSTARDERRLILPLALLRMPTPLRSALFSYLAAHFDARADSVKVPEQTIAGSLESYLAAVSGDEGGGDGEDGNESPRPSKISKDIQLTLAFPGPEVRSLDMTIGADDVAGFMRRGRNQVTNDPTLNQSSATSRNPTSFATGPFTTSLSTYLTTHLALDCTHASIELSRVACGGFALGREGRVKVFTPAASASVDGGNEIVKGLVDALWGIVGADPEHVENEDDARA
jgi:Kinetochore complex Sim4 subunit Fta1